MGVSQLEAVLGRVPSGLFILTVRHKQEETGMLASWVMQAGFEPPMITVAVRTDRDVGRWLTANEPFILNVLRADQKKLLSHFAHGFTPGESAFDEVDVIRTEDDLPALTEALGYLECRPKKHIDSGDHRIFLAEVTGGKISGDGQPYVHIRKSGLRY
jgi:flavin reductase (DIM6/NTAB) family NADH-FMN oxidoreductase RutF